MPDNPSSTDEYHDQLPKQNIPSSDNDHKMLQKINSSQHHPQLIKKGFVQRTKSVMCKVLLLDGEIYNTPISKKALGLTLFENVCHHLDLCEMSYFGLTYCDSRDPHCIMFWLDVNKTVSHQKKRGPWEFHFALKFYPPDPTFLKESLTRYMVCLQIRGDIVSGRLPCTFATQAVLGSFCVQADLGPYDAMEHGDGVDYIKDIPFAPPEQQTQELLEKISQLHRDRKDMLPDQAEIQYLDYAKKIAMYGMHMHAAKDSDYVDIKIGVGATGISVYRENLRINRFVWPKVVKISYRRNKFLLGIRPGEFEKFESMIAFKLPSNKLAKHVWKQAIEHHTFLRLREAAEHKRNLLPRFGSKYRYSGRTLYQTRVLTESRTEPYFERTGSRQYLNNNRTLDTFPKSRSAGFKNANMSIIGTDDSFTECTLDTLSADGHKIPQRVVEADVEYAKRISQPADNPQSRYIERVADYLYDEDDRHQSVAVQLPDPPLEEPGIDESVKHRGVPTILAALVANVPANHYADDVENRQHSACNSDSVELRIKEKPAKPQKPSVKKKPVIVREVDL